MLVGQGTSYAGGIGSDGRDGGTIVSSGAKFGISNLEIGGLLIIYTNNIENNNEIKAGGGKGMVNGNSGGGASGGGSINIFSNNEITKIGTITANGGSGVSGSGAGGKGSVSVGQIINGTYVNTYNNYNN